MGSGDVQALREAGFSDPAIHDASQVVSYFNYINRVADALGHVDDIAYVDKDHYTCLRRKPKQKHNIIHKRK